MLIVQHLLLRLRSFHGGSPPPMTLRSRPRMCSSLLMKVGLVVFLSSESRRVLRTGLAPSFSATAQGSRHQMLKTMAPDSAETWHHSDNRTVGQSDGTVDIKSGTKVL